MIPWLLMFSVLSRTAAHVLLLFGIAIGNVTVVNFVMRTKLHLALGQQFER